MKSLFTLLLLCTGTIALNAQFKVTGKVTGQGGTPVQGVSIAVKGTNTATVSNQNGAYSIQVPNAQAILVFAAVGYERQEVKVKGRAVIDVSLKMAASHLDEVVVVGYATSKRRPMLASPAPVNEPVDREGYDNIKENEFQKVTDHPLSTFSIDVDAASYSNVRRIINEGKLPTPGAVRIEEMINYFSYKYPQPTHDDPFSITTESTKCPWNEKHQLVMIGLQGKKIDFDKLAPCNLVFLIDVSGSMEDENKLPLVKSSLNLLAGQLRPQDKIAIVVYAGNAGLVLPSTNDTYKIKEAINALEAGGSTAGGAGIALAYKIAQENFMAKGNNRVVLCTDGDFNVGASSDDELENLIEQKRASGVYLTVLGFGTGNYQDAKMQKLADKGNGNHAYIDNINEAKKVLISEFGGTLFAIAKDVKLQVEFNPARVKGYRLIGYENRMLNKEDFNNDKKDAGDMGSNHSVTALYEVIPANVAKELPAVDTLRYQNALKKKHRFSEELMYVKVRYKRPDEDISKLMQVSVKHSVGVASDNLRFASAVAAFGMVLRNSALKGRSNYALVKSLAAGSEDLYKKEFLELVKKAEALKGMARVDPEEE